ncbi:uncharacterized protein LOC118439401 [Folsomia candida]|uniref:uncharacterized protein LOC118439401 n=1 Tax=Folsomia candida TaxID=158441 RepID=UPI001604C3D1|nr:uncharacterized protein LOC118439401 [Folsomia candida]
MDKTIGQAIIDKSAFSGIWSAVIQDCIDTFGTGGHLVSIETEEEAVGINEWLERRGSGGSTFWTSGQYVITNQEYVWAASFGSPLTYTAWLEGQPSPFPNGRTRIALVHTNQFSAGWSSVDDTETLRYICEVNTTSITAPPVTGSSSPPTSTTPLPTTTTPTTTTPTTTTPTTTTLPPPDPVVPCTSTLDLIVVLDSSGSIGLDNYQTVKSFVANLSTAFTSHPETRFGLIVYSEGVETVIDLTSGQSTDEIVQAILSARYHAGPTPTDRGIAVAAESLRNNTRAKPQHLIVITDGISNQPDKTKEEADAARGHGIMLYALGITEFVSEMELLDITGGDVGKVFLAGNWDDLVYLMKSVSEALCPEGEDGSGPFSFDYLIGVDRFYNTPGDYVFLDLDLSQAIISQYAAAGRTVMCYVNVGAWEEWRLDAGNFPPEVIGSDALYPGEKWLDIRQTDVLIPLMRQRFMAAERKGCKGVDTDNLNGFEAQTGFSLTAEDQLVYNREIAAEIKNLGMLAGLKNDHSQVSELVGNFDFAVVQNCSATNNCAVLGTFISSGKPVFDIESTDEYTETTFLRNVCPLVEETGISFILKNDEMTQAFLVSCL